MPLLEVVHSTQVPPEVEHKRAFVLEAIEIFRDVLNTPDGRLRIFFYPLQWEDGMDGLLELDVKPDKE